jgi:hypothetical protein
MEKIVLALFCIIFAGMIAAFALGEIKSLESTPCGTASCPRPAENLKATNTPAPEKSPELKTTPAQEENKALEIEILEFSTDKNVYSSSQQLKATIILEASRAGNGITARLHGINAQGSDKVDDSRILDLNEGINTVEFLETTPYCTSGCGGVFPGPYQLLIEISGESELLAQASAAIELIKG